MILTDDCFSTMAIGQLFHVFNVRNDNSFGLGKSLFRHPNLIRALLISFGLQFVVVYFPFLNNVMGTVPINGYKWLIVFVGFFIPTLIIQLSRIVIEKYKTNNQLEIF